MLSECCLAQQLFPQNGQRFMMRGNPSTRNIPLRTLSPDIEYQKNSLSLVVDFGSQLNNRVEVYLINDTTEKVELDNHTMELPIVLEAETAEGFWERAEVRDDKPRFKSVSNEGVMAGYFRKRQCRCWDNGVPIKLRYALYEGGKAVAKSASFEGFLPLGQIDAARQDHLSASIVPEVLRIRFLEDTSLTTVTEDWLHKLELLKSFGPSYVEVAEAQKWAAFVHANPVSTRAERDVALEIQKMMLDRWPAAFDRKALIDNCTRIVSNRATSGANPGLRPISWEVIISELDQMPGLASSDLAKVAWDLLEEEDANGDEKKAATKYLCADAVATKHSPILLVSNANNLLNSDNSYLRIVTANWMLRQRRMGKTAIQAEVLEFYEKFESVSAFELVNVLHFDRIYSPYTDPNWLLWSRALKIDEDYTVSNLSLMYEFDDRAFARKIKLSTNLPDAIKSQLYSIYKDGENQETADLAKRLLERSKQKQRTYSGFGAF